MRLGRPLVGNGQGASSTATMRRRHALKARCLRLQSAGGHEGSSAASRRLPQTIALLERQRGHAGSVTLAAQLRRKLPPTALSAASAGRCPSPKQQSLMLGRRSPSTALATANAGRSPNLSSCYLWAMICTAAEAIEGAPDVQFVRPAPGSECSCPSELHEISVRASVRCPSVPWRIHDY